MKFKNMVGQFNSKYDGLEMMVKADGAIAYGDICTLTSSTQDGTGPVLVVKQSAADSIAVVGVCSEPGGIATGAMGRMTVFGIADCNVASAGYTTPGAIITTNGGGAGYGAVGTPAVGKEVGWAIGDTSGTVTQTKVFVLPCLR